MTAIKAWRSIPQPCGEVDHYRWDGAIWVTITAAQYRAELVAQ